MPDPHDELTAAEAEALAQLPGSKEPPAWLEERIVSELKRLGLIDAAPEKPARAWYRAAAACLIMFLIFLGGLLAGANLPTGRPRATAPDSPATAAPGARHFVLFLYEDESYQQPVADGGAERVEEYRQWGQSLARGGHLVDGVKLKEEADLLPAGGAAPTEGLGMLAGYFILAARDNREAQALAADCPHLKYHGRIVVREVDPV